MFSKQKSFLLCNFDDPLIEQDELSLWPAKWEVDEYNSLLSAVLTEEFSVDSVVKYLKQFLDSEETIEKVFQFAIGAILAFCHQNFNPAPVEINLQTFLGREWPDQIDPLALLQYDSEDLDVNIVYPELLLLATYFFDALNVIYNNMLYLWWSFRCKVMHQRALENTCPSLYSELEVLAAKLSNQTHTLLECPRLQTLLLAEISQAFLIYGRIQKAEEYLSKAKVIAGLRLELKGILGKRTKYQQDSLPQLVLGSELDESILRPSAQESHGATDLPPQINLEDDVRLDKVEFEEKPQDVALPSLEQTLCLLTVQYLQKSQPKDNLADEELLPYLEVVLSQTNSAWSTRVAALLIRCKLEANHKRTVERAMMQCEAIVTEKSTEAISSRLSYLWASGLRPCWSWRQQLADLYMSLGLVKAALDEYQHLKLWEDVIVCYTVLQLRHKAAEVIQREIDTDPTPKLYCLLGDATDDITCYEKAWEFSNFKSSRAQRHWGNYLFDRKSYEECIPHFEKSLEINSLQDKVWLRLGFAALMVENWETSARAYRRYTYLQPNTFEAWNNLAKVYVNQGDKNRAHKALIEALKFNYDNWKLWENVVAVSLDTGYFEDVIRGCHRLLDLQKKFEDVEVLAILVRAVMQDLTDADGNSAARLQKRVLELMGRITSVHPNKPEIWQLYADISPTYLLRAQRLLKAYRGFIQTGNWSNDPATCLKVVQLAQSLLEYSLKARMETPDCDKLQADQQLSSARLTGQAVIKTAEKQAWPEVQDELKELINVFDKLNEYIKT